MAEVKNNFSVIIRNGTYILQVYDKGECKIHKPYGSFEALKLDLNKILDSLEVSNGY